MPPFFLPSMVEALLQVRAEVSAGWERWRAARAKRVAVPDPIAVVMPAVVMPAVPMRLVSAEMPPVPMRRAA